MLEAQRTLALRLGFRPGEWEHLSLRELRDVARAWRWRRSREVELVGVAVALLRAMLDKRVNLPRILRAFPGYDEEGLPRSERVHARARGGDPDAED